MKVGAARVVTIHYTLTDDEGAAIDSSRGAEPLTYLHGQGNLIQGLEQALEGHEAGEAVQATLQPEDAYGQVDPELIQEVALDLLSGVDNLAVGMALEARAADGRVQRLVVDAIGEETATLNANHPLAGSVLHFDVSIEEVREATPEELSGDDG